jgi:TPP-dependent pyruvate/acetoin dehydrogenase alpha subunit
MLSLGRLASAESFTEPLDIAGADPARLREQLRDMLVIRRAEEKIADEVKSGRVKCPCHLAIGQEAVAVGVSEHLRPSDRVFGAHRSHSHYLALGGSLEGLFAEILGRDTGCSRGMGGSMHLYDGKVGFLGSVPIVAATVSIAVGAGIAASKSGEGDVSVSYFGDGAAEEGSVHESMNLAAVYRAPTLFVCENNLFSSHLHIRLRQPRDSVARYAAAHEIPYEVVDGNDVVAVSRATRRLVEAMRAGKGPGFLEAVTYRWRGHVGPSEDIDVGLQRKDDLNQWKRRDPVERLIRALESAGEIDRAAVAGLEAEVRSRVDLAWAAALDAPFPPASALLERVYAP